MPRIAPNQNRPAGEHATGIVAAPARGQGEATEYVAFLELGAADLADPALTVDLAVEGETGDGVFRTLVSGAGWTGGTVGRDGAPRPPRVAWVASDNRLLTRVRVRWTQSRTLRAAVTLDTALVSVPPTARGAGG